MQWVFEMITEETAVKKGKALNKLQEMYLLVFPARISKDFTDNIFVQVLQAIQLSEIDFCGGQCSS